MPVKSLNTIISIIWLIFLSGTSFSEPLNIGTWKTAQTIQPFYYGMFLKAEDKVKIIPFSNPADQKTALMAGSLTMCGTTLAHAIHSASMGQPVVIVAALCNKCSALVVQKEGDIHAVSDLKDKKIGYVPGTMHEIMLRETLVKNGLSPEKDIQMVRVDFFDMGLALAKGNIDGFLSGEPFPTLTVKEGYGRILSYPYFDDSVGTINAGMIVTKNLIENHRDLVLKLVKAHAESTIYLKAHPEEWFQKASAFGTPIDILKMASSNMELSWEMDAHFVKKVKALGERMQALKVIDHQPDYAQLIDLSFVRQVKEELKE